jgi:hypothetical protein
VGRTIAASTSLNSVDLAQLVAHFALPASIFDGTGFDWPTVLPIYADLPLSFKAVVPFLLATLVQHREYLNETLHGDHPLRRCAVWTTGALIHLRDRVHVDQVVSCKHCGMKATGIPPTTLLQHRLEQCESVLMDRIQVFDANVMGRLQMLPSEVKEAVLSSVRIEGERPMSKEDIQTALATAVDGAMMRAQAEWERIISAARQGGGVGGGAQIVPAAGPAAPSAANDHSWWKTWNYAGALCHFVPQGWTWPVYARSHLNSDYQLTLVAHKLTFHLTCVFVPQERNQWPMYIQSMAFWRQK